MNHRHLSKSCSSCGSQRGFTLVELMVSITVALFLLGGMLATVQSTSRTYTNQNLLSQFQDNQRLGMMLMAGVIESTGYYPNVQANVTQVGVLFPADALFPAASQFIIGAPNAAGGPGDQVTVRYAAGTNDNVYNCIGQQNAGATTRWEMTFRVINNQLVCNLNGTDYPIITSNTSAGVTTLGVTNMTVSYGMKASAADTGSCTDTYLTTAQMVANGNWGLVCSVSVTLTFVNPMTTAQTPLNPIAVTRVIALMNKAGVNS